MPISSIGPADKEPSNIIRDAKNQEKIVRKLEKDFKAKETDYFIRNKLENENDAIDHGKRLIELHQIREANEYERLSSSEILVNELSKEVREARKHFAQEGEKINALVREVLKKNPSLKDKIISSERLENHRFEKSE